jgi:hypothetical protein
MEGLCTVCGSIVDTSVEHVHTTPIMTAVLAMFANRLATVGQYTGAMDVLNRYANWAGIVALRDQLVVATVITQAEADAITQIYADNGITLPTGV